MYAVTGKYTMKRGFLMEFIIARIYKLLKETENLIEFEERVQQFMYETFTDLALHPKNREGIGQGAGHHGR